jgi:hypothetical protein
VECELPRYRPRDGTNGMWDGFAGTAEHIGYSVTAGQDVAGAEGGMSTDAEQDFRQYHSAR